MESKQRHWLGIMSSVLLSVGLGGLGGILLIWLISTQPYGWSSNQPQLPDWFPKPPQPSLKVGELLPGQVQLFDPEKNSPITLGEFLKHYDGTKILLFISTCQGCSQKDLLAIGDWHRRRQLKAPIMIITTDTLKDVKTAAANLKGLCPSLILLSDFTKQLTEQKRLSQFVPLVVVLDASNRIAFVKPLGQEWKDWEQTLDRLAKEGWLR